MEWPNVLYGRLHGGCLDYGRHLKFHTFTLVWDFIRQTVKENEWTLTFRLFSVYQNYDKWDYSNYQDISLCSTAYKYITRLSQSTRGLRRGSAEAHLLECGFESYGSIDVCLLLVLRFVTYGLLVRTDHSSRGFLTSVVCLTLIV